MASSDRPDETAWLRSKRPEDPGRRRNGQEETMEKKTITDLVKGTLQEDLKLELKILQPGLENPESVKDVEIVAETAIQEVEPVLEHAKQIEVVDQATYQVAMEGVVRCSKARARIENIFGEARDLANKAHKAITSAIKSLVDPLKQAEKMYGGKAYVWDRAEKARMQAEEIARVKKEEADKEEDNLGVATFLDSAGAHEEAERVLDEPVHVASRKVTGPARPSGTSAKENFQWECNDLKKLVEAVSLGKVPMSVLTTADTVITKMVKALKHETNLPGIKVWDVGTYAVKKK